MENKALITVVVPSYNQGKFLDKCLSSIFSQNLPLEVFVMDGGSTDNTIEVIKKWESKIQKWRSCPDDGQSAAINEGMKLGMAPYCCWLNSDDFFLDDALARLVKPLIQNLEVPVTYGKVYNLIDKNNSMKPIWVESFSEKRLSIRCIISQPGTLIRRNVWESVGGVNTNLHMSMDYDLWWRIFKSFGNFYYIEDFVAVNRDHVNTKTNSKRFLHYKESISVVRKYYGSVPLKWFIAQPYSVWFKFSINYFRQIIKW